MTKIWFYSLLSSLFHFVRSFISGDVKSKMKAKFIKELQKMLNNFVIYNPFHVIFFPTLAEGKKIVGNK